MCIATEQKLEKAPAPTATANCVPRPRRNRRPSSAAAVGLLCNPTCVVCPRLLGPAFQRLLACCSGVWHKCRSLAFSLGACGPSQVQICAFVRPFDVAPMLGNSAFQGPSGPAAAAYAGQLPAFCCASFALSSGGSFGLAFTEEGARVRGGRLRLWSAAALRCSRSACCAI